MRVLAVALLCGAIVLLATGHWVTGLCAYLGGGVAQIRHLSCRPLGAKPIALVLNPDRTMCTLLFLWPLSLMNDLKEFRSPSRFFIGMPDGHIASEHYFARRRAAIKYAASQAAKLGQDVGVVDKARYAARCEDYRTYVVSPDGTVHVRMHWGDGGLEPVRGFPAPAQLRGAQQEGRT
jgi:hypothetical protein